MIAEDIVYIAVDSAEEAVVAWRNERDRLADVPGAAAPRYLAGGTELVTAARRAGAPLSVLIDIKGIPEARLLERSGGTLRLGAALSLNAVRDAGFFPLLSATLRNVADRTTRNRLSLGGNVAGMLPYREAVLPLLLAEARVLTILSERRSALLSERFDKQLALEPGELVLGFELDEAAAAYPWRHYRAAAGAAVDYPLVTSCFMARPEGLRMAVTGLYPYPARSAEADRLLASGAPAREVAAALFAEKGPPRDDGRGSGDYRAALLEDMIEKARRETA